MGQEIPVPETRPSEDEAAAQEEGVGESRRERLRRHARRVRLYLWISILVVMVVILVGLIAANTRRVKVSWVFGDTTERLVWIILVAALAGWVAGIATGVVVRRRIWRNSQ